MEAGATLKLVDGYQEYSWAGDLECWGHAPAFVWPKPRFGHGRQHGSRPTRRKHGLRTPKTGSDAPALYPLTRICTTVAFAIILLAVLLGLGFQS